MYNTLYTCKEFAVEREASSAQRQQQYTDKINKGFFQKTSHLRLYLNNLG